MTVVGVFREKLCQTIFFVVTKTAFMFQALHLMLMFMCILNYYCNARCQCRFSLSFKCHYVWQLLTPWEEFVPV